MGFNTDLLHAGVLKEEKGATLPPIYQNTAFEQESASLLEGIFENKKIGYCYTRVGNPTVAAFENRVTKLERGMASIACSSGMAAITNALLNILRSGDEILSSASLYGGSIDLFRDLEAFGITTRYVKNNDWDEMESAFNEHTRLVYAETIGNPCLDVTDVRKMAEIAHGHGVPLVIDNTTATPYLIRAIEHGADIVINSSSKYINGSSNSISGILTDSGKFRWDFEKYPGLKEYKKFGPMCYIAKLRNGLFRNTGACLAPMTAYQNIIGLETLGLRMEKQCSNAKKLAEWLCEEYPEFHINYPGLPGSPWNEIAKKELQNGFGAILTLRLGTKEKAFRFIDGLKLAYR
ncbi:MAG: aminotransferase class V-fold PLP-dependent enzyme, partial [Acetatifactor sp.]|nr:aminotransferase class V-fold PLP-dependent enzyme [Acetatifactor sp.]